MPQTDNADYIATLPRTKLVVPQDRRSKLARDIDQIDLENLSSIEKFFAHHPELSLLIQYNVTVSGSMRTIKYRMNLIELAYRSLASYTTLESAARAKDCLLYTSPSPRDLSTSRMPSSA